jgi:hypothetical protein
MNEAANSKNIDRPIVTSVWEIGGQKQEGRIHFTSYVY